MTGSLTLLQLNMRISAALSADRSLRDVWVTAETGDLRVSGGHCYMELIDKDESTGRPVARMRAIIWASQFARIKTEFEEATGRRLESDLKVMVRVSVDFHPAFGLSAVISAINPEFTCGDLVRRRQLIIKRLTVEGIIDMNRTLSWPDVPWRVAVVSARGAAGYGDFINHLYLNPSRLRFSTTLFPAVMQGENAPASIIASLDDIASRVDEFDCVVIIRGGGATGDLASFDNYDLAANVAQFPLPVIVGIGHERDVTILDYVAAVRVKTPTAAAEWLTDCCCRAYDRVRNLASEIFRLVSERVSGAMQQLAYYQGLLPSLTLGRVDRARIMLQSSVPDALAHDSKMQLCRMRDRLDASERLIAALSPEAVLRRGYSISRVDGRALRSVSSLGAGCVIETQLADGIFKSKLISNT